MFVNVFWSLLMHAAVVIFLLTFPIYGGNISPKQYGYMRVLLAGPDGGKARHVLKTESKVRTIHTGKGGRSVISEPGKPPASMKEAVNRRNTLKPDSGHGGLPVPLKQTPSLQTDRKIEIARDVSRQAERPRAPEKKKEQTEETYAGGQGMLPLSTPKAEERTVSETIVPDLYKVPQVPASSGQTAPGLPKKVEVSAAESPAPEKKKEQTEETYAGGQGMLPLSTPEAEERTVSEAIVPDLYKVPQTAVSSGQTASGLLKKAEVSATESPPAEKAYTPGPPALQGSTAAPPVNPEPPVSVAAKKGDVGAAKAPESGKAQRHISVEEEIRAAVTRIGETTYGPSGETSKATVKKEVPKLPVGEDTNKDTDEKKVVAAVTPLPLPALKPDSAGHISVEEEIRAAVTRIGETTYGPSGETSKATVKRDVPRLPVGEDTIKDSNGSRVVLTVPQPGSPFISPDVPSGDVWTDGTGREVRAAAPSLSMNAQIHGGEIPSEEDAGKADREGGVPFDWLKTDRADTARAFPMPEAFFIKDIRVNASLSALEMPDVSVKLLNRPLTSETGGTDEDNREVRVEDKTGDTVVGGRVSTEEMFSVAKARKGVYTFVMENRGDLPCDADVTFVFYGGGDGGRIKAYDGVRILPGAAVKFRFVLPQGVFWDDADRFTGSIEDSDSITKFNYDTGLIWKEEKSY